MTKDARVNTVKVPIKVIENRLEFLYGGTLPSLKDGSEGYLVVPRSSIKDETLLMLLEEEEIVEILPVTTILKISISSKGCPQHLKEWVNPLSTYSKEKVVDLSLQTPLYLKLQGTKEAFLLDCKCYIPAFDDIATSINHAYTLISTEFEPHRKSHTGNVFDKVFYKMISYGDN
jgi:hypothetical protein